MTRRDLLATVAAVLAPKPPLKAEGASGRGGEGAKLGRQIAEALAASIDDDTRFVRAYTHATYGVTFFLPKQILEDDAFHMQALELMREIDARQRLRQEEAARSMFEDGLLDSSSSPAARRGY